MYIQHIKFLCHSDYISIFFTIDCILYFWPNKSTIFNRGHLRRTPHLHTFGVDKCGQNAPKKLVLVSQIISHPINNVVSPNKVGVRVKLRVQIQTQFTLNRYIYVQVGRIRKAMLGHMPTINKLANYLLLPKIMQLQFSIKYQKYERYGNSKINLS